MFPVRAGEAVVNNLLQISGTTLDMQVCSFSEDGNLCIITQMIHLKDFRSATTSIGDIKLDPRTRNHESFSTQLSMADAS